MNKKNVKFTWKAAFSFWTITALPFFTVLLCCIAGPILIIEWSLINAFLCLGSYLACLLIYFFVVLLYVLVAIPLPGDYQLYEDKIETGFHQIETRISDIKSVRAKKIVLIYFAQFRTKGPGHNTGVYFESSYELLTFLEKSGLSSYLSPKDARKFENYGKKEK